MGDQNYGIDSSRLSDYAKEIKQIVDKGIQVAVVIGGGNIYRGIQSEGAGFDRVQGDYMGMLATIINGMALQSALESIDVQTRLLTAIRMEQVAEPYIRRKATRHLSKGRVVIFGGGTGNPYFTTDTAATLRAIEIEADVILKGTRVDGIFTADPEKDLSATMYETISFDEKDPWFHKIASESVNDAMYRKMKQYILNKPDHKDENDELRKYEGFLNELSLYTIEGTEKDVLIKNDKERITSINNKSLNFKF